jgi:hypothetical protein
MSEARHCVEAIGVDPGSVFMGMGSIRFFGLFDVTDEEGVVVATVPDIEVVAMERWDLKRGVVTRPTPDLSQMRKVRVKTAPQEKSEKIADWLDSVAYMVGRSEWMFGMHPSLLDKGEARLPVMLVENQFDHIKSDYAKTEMLQIQRHLKTAVRAVDSYVASRAEGGPPPRISCGGMSKYGQRCDASRDRLERKQQAVDDLKELLTQLDTENTRKWLKWLLHMEGLREQIHDMCDAVLSAVHKCEKLFEERERDDIRQAQAFIKEKRALIKKIPYAPMRPRKVPKFKDGQVDDPEDEGDSTDTIVKEVPKEKKVRKKKEGKEPKEPKPKAVKKRAPKKTDTETKASKRKRVEEVPVEKEEPVKKKQHVYPMLLLDMCEEVDLSQDDK